MGRDGGLVEDDQLLEGRECAKAGPRADADVAGTKDQASELRQGCSQGLNVRATQLKAGAKLQSVNDAVQRGGSRKQI